MQVISENSAGKKASSWITARTAEDGNIPHIILEKYNSDISVFYESL